MPFTLYSYFNLFYRHPSHYKEHCRRHTGESPYQCTDCSARYKTRNTFKRHLKVHHGKLLTASGTHTPMPTDAFAQVQEVEKGKEQNKSNNKIQSINGEVHSNNNLNVAVSIKPIVEIGRQHDVNNVENRASYKNAGSLSIQDDDDFVVDYHYGDSILNDEEVARISHAATSQEGTIKFINEEGTGIHVDQSCQFTNKCIPGDGRQLQERHRNISTMSSESYYPSSNSEFSTPRMEELTSMTKCSPIGCKTTETPPLLKFAALPPTTIASAANSATFLPNEPLQKPDAPIFGISTNKSDLLQRKRNYSETSLPLKHNIGSNSVSKQSAFDPISTFRLSSINKNQTEANGTNGVIITVPSDLRDRTLPLTVTSTGQISLQGATAQRVLPDHSAVRDNSNSINKPSFTLSSSSNNRKTFIVQTGQSGNSSTSTIAPRQGSQHIILKEAGNNISNSNKNRIILSQRPVTQNRDQVQKTTFAQCQGTNARHIKTTFPISGNSTNASSNISISSSSIQHPKQALLAQINGRQVLLIPKQEESSVRSVDKTTSAPVIISSQQIGTKETMFPSPQYKILRMMPPQKVNSSGSAFNIAPAASNMIEEDNEPSKLEQCLRYGSAAVVKPIITSSNVPLPYSESQQRIIISNPEPLQSTPLASTSAVSTGGSFFERQLFDVKTTRESIDYMRRDSSDSGKSDIITSSTVDIRSFSNEQTISYQLPSPISSQASKSYHSFLTNNPEGGYVSSSVISHENGQFKDINASSANVIIGESSIVRVTSISPDYKPLVKTNGIGRINYEQIEPTVNKDVVIKKYKVCSSLEQHDYRRNQLHNQQPEASKFYESSDQHYLSGSSGGDSGFIEQSPNITPQSINFSHNSTNLLHVSSSNGTPTTKNIKKEYIIQ